MAPTRIDLTHARPTQAITVVNSGSETTTIQLNTFRWSQAGNQDEYQPDYSIVASPPIFQLQPGEKQVIRVGLRGGSDRAEQQAYRIYIQEVPEDAAEGEAGLKMALRIGVPLFWSPGIMEAADLQWSLTCDHATRRSVYLRNTGGSALRIHRLQIGTAVDVSALYVLSGSERTFDFDVSVPNDRDVEVMAVGDHGDIRAHLSC